MVLVPSKLIIQYHSFRFKFWRYLEAGEDNLEKKLQLSWISKEAQS